MTNQQVDNGPLPGPAPDQSDAAALEGAETKAEQHAVDPEDQGDPTLDPAVQALDAICRRMGGFDPDIDAEWTDGYLTALAAGPRKMALDEWLPSMFGDAFERAFADPADVAEAAAVLARHAAGLAAALDPAKLVHSQEELIFLTPLMQEWDEAARQEIVSAGLATADDAALIETGAVWAEGFFDALQAHPLDWPDASELRNPEAAETYQELLNTVAALMWERDSEDFKAFAARNWKDANPTRDELINEACFAVQDLRVFWLDNAIKPPPRVVLPTPGRNDACSCGSGKKFKKCCGATA